MAGFDPEVIMKALAAQLRANIDVDTHVSWCPMIDPPIPSLCVYPGVDTIPAYFATLGADGVADLNLRIKLQVDADDESMAIKICRYLSVGTGHGSSVPDAVHADKTLGGTVAVCTILSAQWADPDSEAGVAWWPVKIHVHKIGATT